MIKALLLVGTGGFLGSISRYLIQKFMLQQWGSTFPWGTFTANIIGSFIIGIIIGISLKNDPNFQENHKLFLATGFCGGFTTFSSFSLENLQLLQNGETFLAFGYIVLSVIMALAAVFTGFLISR